MTDTELLALTALVNRETVDLDMQKARYGEFMHDPSTLASRALDAELYRRGIFAQAEGESATKGQP